MRFLADESCDFAVVRALHNEGYDVTAVKEMMPGAHDEDVIKYALRESRILLTEDKDFGQLVFANAVKSPGVIFIRFPGNARQTMAETVVELVRNNKDKIENRFVVVQPKRIRITE